MTGSRRNAVGGAAFLAIGALALYAGADLDMGSLLVPGPGALPKAALLAMCALAAALLLSGRRNDAAEAGDPPDAAERGAYVRVAATVAAILAFVLALPALGFLASSAVLMAFLAGLGAEKPWSVPAMLGGLLTAVAAYLLFAKALGVPLPAGSMWGA